MNPRYKVGQEEGRRRIHSSFQASITNNMGEGKKKRGQFKQTASSAPTS